MGLPYGVSFVAYYYAYDTANDVYKTGDSGNHSLQWTADGTDAAATNSPAEVDATNSPGLYKVTITAAEAQCLAGSLSGKSSTGDIVLMFRDYDFLRLPNVAPAANGGLATVDANNYVAGIQGTKNQLDDLNDIDGSSVSGTVDLNADQSGVTIGTVNAMAGTITTLDALDTAQDTQHAQTQTDIGNLNDIDGTGLTVDLNADQSGVTVGTTTTIGATGIAAIWSYAKASAAALATTTIGRYIYDKLSFLTTGNTVTVVEAVANAGEILIFQGESKTVQFSVDGTTLDLTGFTPKLALTKITSNSGSDSAEISGSVVNAGASDQYMTFTIPKATTAALALDTKAIGQPFRTNTDLAYEFQAGATDGTGGNCPTTHYGWASVNARGITC